MTQYSQEDLFILAIRRSGNHAIANWLIPHFSGIIRYFNDYVFLVQKHAAEDPLKGNPTYLYLTQDGQTFCIMNKGQVWTIQEIIARELTYRLKKKLNRFIQKFYPPEIIEQMINELSVEHVTSKLPYWVDEDYHIKAVANLFGCENHTPQQLVVVFPEWRDFIYKKAVQSRNLNVSGQRTFLLVLRDPFNNLASLMQKPSMWPPNHITLEQFPATWIAYAKEYLGETSNLKALGKVVLVNYNRWFVDRSYRQQLSEQLEKSFTDTGLKKMSPNGGGSSFDQLTWSDNAQNMKVLERWKIFQQNRTYRDLLKNEELLTLSKQIYGKPPFPI